MNTAAVQYTLVVMTLGSMTPYPLLVALISTAAGCSSNTCTTDYRASVTLMVIDAETGEDVDATITFRLDGDGPREPEEEWPGTYVLASELEGVFSVTIEADGYDPLMRIYEVMADECHVISVEDTISMTPTP